MARTDPAVESARCPLCPESALRTLYDVKDRMFDLDGVFPLVECSSCGMRLLSKRPTASAMKKYYPEGEYYAYGGAASGLRMFLRKGKKAKAHIQRSAARSISWATNLMPVDYRIAAKRPGGKILEVGCGDGETLDLYRHLGWQTYGVERSNRAIRVASSKGHHMRRGFLSVHFPPNSFDLVRFRHVLEHTPDPLREMTLAFDVLKPGGLLVIDVPNIGGWLSRVAGQWYWQIDAPRHLYGFTSNALLRIVEKVGFRTAHWTTYSSGSGVLHSAGLWLRDKGWPGFKNYRIGSTRWAWRLADGVMDGLLGPAMWVIDKAKQGENLCVEALKPAL